MTTDGNRRIERYALQPLELVRDAILRAASPQETSQAVYSNAVVNPLIDQQDRLRTIDTLRNTVSEVPSIPGASALSVAAMLAGDWLLAFVSALLTEDHGERETVLILLRGDLEATRATVGRLAESAGVGDVYFPVVVQFIHKLVTGEPDSISYEWIGKVPGAASEMVVEMLTALNCHPLGEELRRICPRGGYAEQCLLDAVSNGGAGGDVIRLLYEVSAADDILAVPVRCRVALEKAEQASLPLSIDDSVWERLRLARASAELAVGDIDLAANLASESVGAKSLHALTCLEKGDLTVAEWYENTSPRDSGIALVAEVAGIVRECVDPRFRRRPGAEPVIAACAVSELDDSFERSGEGGALVNEAAGTLPRSTWDECGVASRTVVRCAIETVGNDRLDASQKSLERLGELADQLLNSGDAYRMLAKWLRFIQSERLYRRGRYGYSLRVFRYVRSLFARGGAPEWLTDHIEQRIAAILTLEASEFTS